jgi:hypothetical protein
MKQLLLLNIILAALSAPAHAATIQAFATQVNTTYGSLSATAGGPALSTDAEIQTIIASDANAAIFGYSPTDYSVIDLGFGDTVVKTGSGGDTLGADLVVVSLWNDIDYRFGLEAFDTAGTSLSSYYYTVNASTPDACSSYDTAGVCLSYVKTTSINLLDISETELADGIELGYVRMTIGGTEFNGSGGLDGYSNFSLVGAYHTDATVVPLPLPAILFSSGLLFLGWVGRRKTA